MQAKGTKMANCELCGKETVLFRTDVEGTELEVCRDCSGFGKTLARSRNPVGALKVRGPAPLPPELEEPKEVIVPNFAQLVKHERERRGLKQEECAKMINEKESVLQKIETGALEPPIALAKKFESILGIKLITPAKEELQQQTKGKTDQVTIGDIIKLK